MAYDLREGTYGTEQGHFAEVLADGTFGEVNSFTGLRGVNIEETQDPNVFYADDQQHLVINGAKQRSGDMKAYQISNEYALLALGKKVMPNGGLVDTGVQKNFAFWYIRKVANETGVEVPELVIYYNLKAGMATGEDVTSEEGIDLKELTIPLTAIPNSKVLDEAGNPVASMVLRRTDENAALFDTFKTKVLLPTDPIVAAKTTTKVGE